MTRRLLLVFGGLLTELLWALDTLALQKRWTVGLIFLAAFAPYVAAIIAAVTVVDETRWSRRLEMVTWYAVGAVLGICLVMSYW